MASPNPVTQAIIRSARKHDVDPEAAIAVARGEGGLKWGAVGDKGTSHGPFQLRRGGALPKGKSAAWANSPAGIDYAIRRMAESGARGLRGAAAVDAIVRNFERPYDPDTSVKNAVARLKSSRVSGTGVPPPTMTGPLTPPPPGGLLGMDMTETALSNLGRIAMGEKATDTLADLVTASQMPTPATPPPGVTLVDPAGKKVTKAVKVSDPGGGWGGAYNPATALANLGKAHGLSAVSEKRDRQSTKSGGVSDHWVGSKDAYAYDLSNGKRPTAEMDRAAIKIARRLGVKYSGKGPLVLTKTVGGYRYQVLYRTQVGGNHNDHIHVGVRRVGG
jgi:hypothetical protein